MLFKRETGVLLHLTSLPGNPGNGTLGQEAYDFADWLIESGASTWQILPVSPPVFGRSPYQTLSSFAIDPLLIDTQLVKKMYLEKGTVSRLQKEELSRAEELEILALHILSDPPAEFSQFFEEPWVQRWSTFAALRELNGYRAWVDWAPHSGIEVDNPLLLKHAMIQYLAFDQWWSLLKHCRSIGLKILGDLPIYAAHDSEDVFFNRNIFKLDDKGDPLFIAGVPPDYFSPLGQLWGNPVYSWASSEASGHKWWISRMKHALGMFDAVRIDHFRGFESYWEIPRSAKDARGGKWAKGPGKPFFDLLKDKLGILPVVAEDLGMITGKVRELRKQCGFPGMTVLQFALMDPAFNPDFIESDTVVYTGTHDNDSTAGWLESPGRSLGYKTVREIIRIALNSPSQLAVIPMQDILALNSSSRMNTPGTSEGNWMWRLDAIPSKANLARP